MFFFTFDSILKRKFDVKIIKNILSMIRGTRNLKLYFSRDQINVYKKSYTGYSPFESFSVVSLFIPL